MDSNGIVLGPGFNTRCFLEYWYKSAYFLGNRLPSETQLGVDWAIP